MGLAPSKYDTWLEKLFMRLNHIRSFGKGAYPSVYHEGDINDKKHGVRNIQIWHFALRFRLWQENKIYDPGQDHG